ncbi:hypothetical protein BLNAU_10286 [Blattamonas nauphoetae]|uniref:Uncharacterized protein n=1 Tax=Blattamonas nauphoetae TaxID=2049346 RepID=A0ABQ9XTJ7_9EUKA|nr:hypothetical protein BLNAU_10286 [Blattamonas nauphoetae]
MVRDDFQLDEELLMKSSTFLFRFSQQLHHTNNADNILKAIGQRTADPAAVFVDSVTVLLSSSHQSIIRNTLPFIVNFSQTCLSSNRLALVSSKLIPRLLSTPYLRDLSVIEDNSSLSSIISIFRLSVGLAQAISLKALSTTSHTDPQRIRDVVLREVLIPIEPSLVQISRNHRLSSWIHKSEEPLALLVKIFEISAFHRPTLDYICSSRIPMVFQSLLSKVEDDWLQTFVLSWTSDLVSEWQTDEAETVVRGKGLLKILEQEGFINELEITLLHDDSSTNRAFAGGSSFDILNSMGMNIHDYW